MRNICLTIQYDGKRYSGWQKQGNTGNTIQGKLEVLLSKMTGEDIELHGSGRTDAGVHAMAQVANFKTNTDMVCSDICSYVNKYLPEDIRVTDTREADMRFHARLNAKKKHYRYLIDTGRVKNVFTRDYAYHISEELDIESMKRAAELLIGEHDFMSFCENRHMKKSTVRTIYDISITKNGAILELDYLGNGFLYHMVRIMTGTLIEVGLGKRKPEDIKRIFEGRKRESAGFLAPAHGLALVEVEY